MGQTPARFYATSTKRAIFQFLRSKSRRMAFCVGVEVGKKVWATTEDTNKEELEQPWIEGKRFWLADGDLLEVGMRGIQEVIWLSRDDDAGKCKHG